MKKIIFTIGVCLMAWAANAQIRYGFAFPNYDNFNIQDPNASVELVVYTPNNDTLKINVGSTVSCLPGSAVNGVDFNFTPLNWTFLPGTTIYAGTNRKKLSFNFVPNSTFWGTKYFYVKLTNLVGVTSSQLLYDQDQITVYIDYDGTNVGLPKLSIHDYKLYPVPATTQLFVEGVNTTQYKIYDLAGRLIKEGEPMQNSVDVSELNTGLYVLNAISDKGMIVQKFMKQ